MKTSKLLLIPALFLTSIQTHSFESSSFSDTMHMISNKAKMTILKIVCTLHKYGSITSRQAISKNEKNFTAINEINAEVHNPDMKLHAMVTQHFFNPQDKTPFSVIIEKIIEILQEKKVQLSKLQQIACNNLIKTLEEHKNTKDLETWANLVRKDEFYEILPDQTKNELESLGEYQLGMMLFEKLQNA